MFYINTGSHKCWFFVICSLFYVDCVCVKGRDFLRRSWRVGFGLCLDLVGWDIE